jgi:ribosomal protein L3 glutamine methyltransferase
MTARRTLRALLEQSVGRFEDARLAYGHGTANALDEAAWLILHALGYPLHELDPHLDEVLDEARWRKARSLIDRRIRTRKPAAYLLKEAWLGPHRFYVDERVIVPRSFIAEMLLKPGHTPFSALRGGAPPHGKWGTSRLSVLDMCTGSGCLAILAALAFPQAQVDAADLSGDALAVAKINVAGYGLDQRVHLVKSDLFEALEGRRYDLIVSNPPYVKAASMRTLPDEYRHEPKTALASGRDGLDHTRTILAHAKRHLHPRGKLLVEIGHNRKALERAYPRLPFEWPPTSAGPGYVFALEREQLPGA